MIRAIGPAIKRRARRAVERVLDPHLDAQAARIETMVAERLGARDGSPVDPILADFNERLHELRTIELRHLPVHGGVVLSAGCAGRWYFDWLEECAGPFERHIGVELYSVRPDDLPDGVTWISASASAMPDVGDGSVDVVFSGQNLEHLWIDDLAGFLCEASRVLRPGGMLVVDSPNRLVTEALGWVHPEHTIELSVPEISDLLALAGFEPRVVRGLWCCRDQRTGAWLPLLGEPGDVGELLERASGRRPVDDDFVWWVEAERVAGVTDVARLRARIGDLFERHWPERVNRAAGCVGVIGDDGRWQVAAGSEGVVYRTHGFPIFAGAFRVATRGGDPALRIRLVRPDGSEIASGIGSVAGRLERAEFGVSAEIVADAPLTAPLAGPAVTVELDPQR